MRTLPMTLAVVLAMLAPGCDTDDPPADSGADGGDADAPECTDDDDCDDDVDCTTSYCQGGRCRHTGDPTLCDDGRQCNGAERCDPLHGCAEGSPLVCDDHIECTDDVCDAEQDRCISTPNDDRCAEGYVCDRPSEGCIPE